jgi:hypothetical protein
VTLLATGTSTAAEVRANGNLEANLHALKRTQPGLVEVLRTIELNDIEWILGRDGSLTARTTDAGWWAGCSLPRRAAMAQLKRLDVSGAVACFLLPPTAAAIAVALEKLRPEQALVAMVPQIQSLRLIMSCYDFSTEIAAHRAWFVTGEDWPCALDELFDERPGLSIPTQFIRLTSSDPEQIEQAITAAQKVLSDVTARRARQMHEARDAWRGNARSARRLLVVAPSQFRLWNDWGSMLLDACAGEGECMLIDPDDPGSSSPLMVVQRARGCDAIVTIDTSRADAPGVLPEAMPWVTWVTNGRIPARSGAGPDDRVVLLDEEDRAAAIRAGWDGDQLGSAQPQAPTVSSGAGDCIGVLADTASLDPPENIDDYSSHRPLWEYVADELTRNPFALGDDADSYLTSRMRRFDVGEQTINRAMFAAALIVPAYQQGLLAALIEAGVPVRIAGKGWGDIERFAQHAAGPIATREDLAAAIARSSLLLHVWPDRRVHAIDFAGRPVLRAARTRDRFLRDAREALRSPVSQKEGSFSIISPTFLRQLLARAR